MKKVWRYPHGAPTDLHDEGGVRESLTSGFIISLRCLSNYGKTGRLRVTQLHWNFEEMFHNQYVRDLPSP